MKKLYEKNELNFALLLIAIYCVKNIPMRASLGDESVWLLAVNLAIAALITWFIKKNHLEAKYGLNAWPQNARRLLYYLPLCIVATCNFWGGFQMACQGMSLVCASITMVLIGYIEEILFRGFLYKAIEKQDGRRNAIIISAVTFGIGHILNLFSQPGLDTLMQVVYAVSFGFMFVYLFIKSKSLWPCIALHSFIDLTSKYGKQDISIFVVTGVVSAICIAYTVYLARLKEEEA